LGELTQCSGLHECCEAGVFWCWEGFWNGELSTRGVVILPWDEGLHSLGSAAIPALAKHAVERDRRDMYQLWLRVSDLR
jgi:hypothetical protein